jgi:hypothetical protein
MFRTLVHAILLACGFACAACSKPQSWLMIDVGGMGAIFLDMNSVGRSHEPELLDLLDLTILPDTGQMITGKKRWALWCSSQEAQLKSFTFHYEDGRSRRAEPPPEKFVPHPVADDDAIPGMEIPGFPPTRKGQTSKLAQIVCERIDADHIATEVEAQAAAAAAHFENSVGRLDRANLVDDRADVGRMRPHVGDELILTAAPLLTEGMHVLELAFAGSGGPLAIDCADSARHCDSRRYSPVRLLGRQWGCAQRWAVMQPCQRRSCGRRRGDASRSTDRRG